MLLIPDDDFPAIPELHEVRPMTQAELEAAADEYQREQIETARSEENAL